MQCGQAKAGGVQVVVETDQRQILRNAATVLTQTEQCRNRQLVVAQADRRRGGGGGDDPYSAAFAGSPAWSRGQRHRRDRYKLQASIKPCNLALTNNAARERSCRLVIADIGDRADAPRPNMIHCDMLGGDHDADAGIKAVVREEC